MSNRNTFSALALAVLCVPAAALAEGVVALDANDDGLLSVVEVQEVYPDVTAEQFSAMDLNADGALNDAEVQAAIEAGVMPAAPAAPDASATPTAPAAPTE